MKTSFESSVKTPIRSSTETPSNGSAEIIFYSSTKFASHVCMKICLPISIETPLAVYTFFIVYRDFLPNTEISSVRANAPRPPMYWKLFRNAFLVTPVAFFETL